MRGMIPEEMDRDASGRAEEFIRGVYGRRCGCTGVQSDEAIRENLRRVEMFRLRHLFAGNPDRWFEEESAWATACYAIERAMVSPLSSPTYQGQWEAEAARTKISKIAERLARMDDDEVNSVISGLHSQVVLSCPGLRGPVFRDAFTKRCLEIIEEEVAACSGR